MSNLPKNLRWNITVYVENGPTLSSTGDLDPGKSDVVHAVDTVNVVAGSGDTTVSVQPGSLDKIEFMYIASDQYGDGTNLSYTFMEGAGAGDASSPVVLEKPHILTSGSLIGLFDKAPKEIKISNGTGTDAKIDVVVARKAV
ncbi:MAG: hypothetical protein M3M89_07170 [Thermoproteota archaeon]|nr:hypothetical protein [Thermoproteota archaeon]